MSVLAALQNGTRLLLRPQGSEAFISMPIPVGKMLVWRADVVHAGPSYEQGNVRIHAYVDSASCRRPPNETFPVALSEAGIWHRWMRLIVMLVRRMLGASEVGCEARARESMRE